MERKTTEFALQHYLIKNNGLNLKKIDPSLTLIETEHRFRGGRIDILAQKQETPVGLELKSLNYQTRGICAQLLNYLNYLSSRNGEVYFVAPKIKYGIYSTLKNYYEEKKLKLFEYVQYKNDLIFNEIKIKDLNDFRKINSYDLHNYTQYDEFIDDEKLKKGISIIVKNDKKAKLLHNLIDTNKSKNKQIEDITDSIINLIPEKKYSIVKTIYELLKLI